MEIFLAVLKILGGFIVLVWGADRFVYGAAATASNLGVSTLVIGLTVVGFGTSAPEILVSIMAALQGSPGIAVGNALGSNITNIGMVLGTTALICPLMVNSRILKREFPVMLAMMCLGLFLLWDRELSRVDGAVLLCGLIALMVWLVYLGRYRPASEAMTAEFEEEIPHIPLRPAIFWTLLGLILLLISSRILVSGAVTLAGAFGVSDLVIGLTIVAIGTSLPELAASIMSAIKKEPDIAIGNVIGSNMFNLLAVLGIPGLIAPMALDEAVLTRDYATMLILTGLLFVFAYGFRGKGRINRLEGGILLTGYLAYLTVLYFTVGSDY